MTRMWGQVLYGSGSSAKKASGSMGCSCVPLLMFTENQTPLGAIDAFSNVDMYFVPWKVCSKSNQTLRFFNFKQTTGNSENSLCLQSPIRTPKPAARCAMSVAYGTSSHNGFLIRSLKPRFSNACIGPRGMKPFMHTSSQGSNS